MPRFDSVWPIRAVSFMRRKWHAIEISQPPPVAWPLIAAMTGLGKRSILRITVWPKRMKVSTCPPENAEPRSAPPQKIRSPAPVMMTERTVASSSTEARAAWSSSTSFSLIALAGGRFRVMTAKVSSRANSSVSNAIGTDSFEEDGGDGLRRLAQAVAAAAQDPGGRELGDRVAHQRHPLGHLLAEERDEDLVLRLEVEVDRAGGDPGLARDVRHARVVVAVAREHADRGVDDLLRLVGGA